MRFAQRGSSQNPSPNPPQSATLFEYEAAKVRITRLGIDPGDDRYEWPAVGPLYAGEQENPAPFRLLGWSNGAWLLTDRNLQMTSIMSPMPESDPWVDSIPC